MQTFDNKVDEILCLLEAQGQAARLYSHEDIDRDFCFLARSKLLVLGNGHFSLSAAKISNARCLVPPWAKTGSELTFDEMIEVETTES